MLLNLLWWDRRILVTAELKKDTTIPQSARLNINRIQAQFSVWYLLTDLNRNQNPFQTVPKASVHALQSKSFLCCVKLQMSQYITRFLLFVWFSSSFGQLCGPSSGVPGMEKEELRALISYWTHWSPRVKKKNTDSHLSLKFHIVMLGNQDLGSSHNLEDTPFKVEINPHWSSEQKSSPVIWMAPTGSDKLWAGNSPCDSDLGKLEKMLRLMLLSALIVQITTLRP